MTARVTLYSRAECHLCEEARLVIDRVCRDLGESFVEIDIDSDPELAERWTDDVPVTMVDGKQHDFWRVSEERLRSALAE
ncbi:glutaredoxin [Nocardioides daedukensis]|uniref:Glutaredoxin n=1 Tax=Nocardioides daedukensis TaxID=634462 RepID=A0A7Y9UVT6_9ACTN|nr:glutaredoxin family protein [Nocardioides daedukensis]NYG58890.1 glutaredoxin [Nocardioides daedukensis]